jgi:hypothetical protein
MASTWALFATGFTFAVGAAVLGVGGCTTTVDLKYGACEVGDNAYDVDEIVPASPESPCDLCTCGADGKVHCDKRCCIPAEFVVPPDGEPGLEPEKPDSLAADGMPSQVNECIVCTCSFDAIPVEGDDGEPGGSSPVPGIECVDLCATCDDSVQFECAQPVDFGCTATKVCGEFGWECVDHCDPCTTTLPPDPSECGEPPLGCYHEQYCSPEIGWYCGALVCTNGCYYDDGLFYPAGEFFPSIDGCNLCYCDDFGQVYCESNECPPCVDPEPLCEDDEPEDGFPPPGCYFAPVCIQGTSWECQVICQADCDPVEQPACPEPQQNCTYEPMCTPKGWICEQNCMGQPCDTCAVLNCGPYPCFQTQEGCGACVEQ